MPRPRSKSRSRPRPKPKLRLRPRRRPRARALAANAKLLLFAGKFLACFILLSLAWNLFAPSYNKLVVAAANGVMALIERPRISTLRVVGDNIGIYLHEEGRLAPWGYSGYGLHYGLVLLISLFVATLTPNLGPRPLRWLKLLLIGLAILFVVHVIALLGRNRLAYVYHGVIPGNTKSFLFSWVNVLLVIGERLFPVLIWGGLTFRYLLPGVLDLSGRGEGEEEKK